MIWRARSPALRPIVGIAVRATPDAIRQLRGGEPVALRRLDHIGEPRGRRRRPGRRVRRRPQVRRRRALGPGIPDQGQGAAGRFAGDDRPGWWRRRRRRRSIGGRSLAADDHPPPRYRCVHGENDGLPGLSSIATTARSSSSSTPRRWFSHLADRGRRRGGSRWRPERIVLRLSRARRRRRDVRARATARSCSARRRPRPVLFRERGLMMEADVVHGQKTGHFLDQRDNRALVRGSRCQRATCSMCSPAPAGSPSTPPPAGQVGAHDRSLGSGDRRRRAQHRPQLAPPRSARLRRPHHGRRRLRGARPSSVDGPSATPTGSTSSCSTHPSFAMSQANVERALRAYAKLTRLGVALLRPGGMLVQASCSSRVTADDFLRRSRRRPPSRPAAARDPPHRPRRRPPDRLPQGAYLKALFATA